MKNRIKNGFTLVEILITVSIMALIFSITVPNLMKTYNNVGSRTYRNKKTLILEAAKLYGSDNLGSFNDSKLQINVADLVRNSYITADVSFGEEGCGDNYGCMINPDNSSNMNNMCIMITKQGENFEAEWSECKEGPYKIIINTDGNGGIRKIGDVDYKVKLEYNIYKGSDITFEHSEPRNGYHYSELSCTKGSFTSSTTEKKVTITDINSDLNCTIGFIPNTYTVKFNVNGGSGYQTSNVTATYDKEMPTISTTKPTKTGYTFGGWYNTSATTGGTQYYTDEGKALRIYDQTNDITLYARWSANSYTIEFNGNGNTGGSTASITCTYDVACKLTKNGFKKSGYNFSGWATTASGKKAYGDKEDVNAKHLATGGTITLYAKWSKASSSGGGSGDPEKSSPACTNAGGCCWCGCGCGGCLGGCFLADMQVSTLFGPKNIKDIKIGDFVLSYNTKTGKNEYKQVLKTYIYENQMSDLYSLTVENSTLKVTGKHPFFIKNENGLQWVLADKLKVGDYVMQSNSTFHRIDEISHVNQINTVYNLAVEDNNNYYVSKNNILVLGVTSHIE